MTEREQFEAWHRDNVPGALNAEEWAWEAWQARGEADRQARQDARNYMDPW